MSFVSFAQNFEDVMLWRALGHVEHGFYIDVGAWSPELDSVTKAFYDRGWNGINVEPNPSLHAELAAARPRDVNLQLAITDANGMADFHPVAAPTTGLSTLDRTIAVDHAAHGRGGPAPFPVATRTLATICRDHVPPAADIHFLKIDAEGSEETIVRGADWERHRPWIVVVEATQPMSRTETHAAWEPMLARAGYTLAYRDGLNRFYVAKEHTELAAAFAYPPNVFDDFVPAVQHRSEASAAALRDMVDGLQRENRDLKSSLDAIRSSWSWRLTRPLRSALRGTRKHVPFRLNRNAL